MRLSTFIITLGALLIASQSYAAPTATKVKVLGYGMYNTSTSEGTTLTGFYDYYDADGNAEGASTYKWYSDGVEIIGATDIRYTLTAADVGTVITFGVTPVSTVISGSEIISANSVTVATTTTINNVSTTNNVTLSNGSTVEYLNLTLNYAATQKVNISNSSTIIVYGDLIATQAVEELIINGATLIIYGQLIATAATVKKIEVSNSSVFNIGSGIESLTGLNMFINSGTTSTIDGNVNVDGAGSFMKAEGSLTINGDVNVGATTTLTAEGTLAVKGDLTGGASSSLGGNGVVNVDGIVSGFTIGGGVHVNQKLPIELTYFKAITNNNAVTLNWETATEENNDYFTIERSSNGKNFEIIENLSGAGNSSTAISYTVADNSPLSGVSYYRLKQTDFNGVFTYSNIVSVAYNGLLSNANLSLTAYPNPYKNGALNLSSDAIETGSLANIQIVDVSGKIVFEKSISAEQQRVSINPKLKHGIYFVTVKSNKYNSNSRLLVE